MTDLPALLTRLRAATGPDRTLDADICVALQYHPDGRETIRLQITTRDHRILRLSDRAGSFSPPRLTGSIDAAVDLVERMLPGAPLTLITLGNPDNQSIAVLHIDNGATTPPTEIAGEGPTAGLAILIATIEALMAREGGDE